MPEPPSPAMARPTMNAVEVGAAPHKADPTSKVRMDAKKVYLMLKEV